MLLHALSADPDDRMAHGKLRLAEGHLARINGTSHKSAAQLNDAVEKFTQAQQFMPQSPDPALGLARVYVYGLKDIDRASQAFDQAVNHGYKRGIARSRNWPMDTVSAPTGSGGFTQRARAAAGERPDPAGRDDCKRALDLYQQSAPYRKRQRAHGAGAKQLEASTPLARTGSAGECRAEHAVAGAIVGLIERCAASGRAEPTAPWDGNRWR